MDDPPADPRRRIPAVDRLLDEPGMSRLASLYGRERVRVQVQRALGDRRDRLRPGAAGAGAAGDLGARFLPELEAEIDAALAAEWGAPLRRALNATGIFLHTNLGRAPLPREVAAALPPLLDAACDLELDLAAGRRDNRNRRVERLLRLATGAGAALVVNNNAAALALALQTLAAGREVVVSRGELVEIGGAFRVPEILVAAGARLVEVGTTNRTRLADYAAAVGPATALLLKVFPSNYRQRGFVAAVGCEALVELGRARGLPLLVDEGSGLLRRHPAPQLAGHPSLAELVAAGCDLVCGSGDKLLGGPQAGILLGGQDLVERCHRHAFYRALRPDRSTLATLEGVLRLHLAGARLPLDRMWPDPDEHRARLAAILIALGAASGGEIVPAEAFLGGGSAPEAPIPGEALAWPGDEELARRLRLGDPPVVGYLREGKLVLDLRTVDPQDDPALAAALRRALAERPR
jgi:L-seryl-tRNA(Ser) seleniumtransferase